MTLDEAKAMIARADALPREATEEQLREVGYVLTEGGVWELPIPLDVLYQLLDETEPSSEESKAIAARIVSGIGGSL